MSPELLLTNWAVLGRLHMAEQTAIIQFSPGTP